MKKPSVTFTPFGARTQDYDSQSEILVGANLGVAQVVGWIERHIEWEHVGSSRAYSAVPGGTTFTVEAYDEDSPLVKLQGVTFRSIKEVHEAVRKIYNK